MNLAPSPVRHINSFRLRSNDDVHEVCFSWLQVITDLTTASPYIDRGRGSVSYNKTNQMH